MDLQPKLGYRWIPVVPLHPGSPKEAAGAACRGVEVDLGRT
jgi:hypothetical protein